MTAPDPKILAAALVLAEEGLQIFRGIDDPEIKKEVVLNEAILAAAKAYRVMREALDEAFDEIERLRTALRNATRNDRSRYNHHEPRPFDGKKPSPGTIWLTPREIARGVLQEPALATGDDL